MNSNPLTCKTARKRLYFNNFKERLVHFNGTVMRYFLKCMIRIVELRTPMFTSFLNIWIKITIKAVNVFHHRVVFVIHIDIFGHFMFPEFFLQGFNVLLHDFYWWMIVWKSV